MQQQQHNNSNDDNDNNDDIDDNDETRAILDVMERAGRTNPDRVRMRIGQVMEVVGILLVLAGFAGFIYFGFVAVSEATVAGPSAEILISLNGAALPIDPGLMR